MATSEQHKESQRAKIWRMQEERVELLEALRLFIAAYEMQDATNFTNAMRDAYATASALVGETR